MSGGGGIAPLDGFVVLDLTQNLPGPYATLLLARMGAEVIKLEPPGGDPARYIDAAMFRAVNAGKRSICLDLREEAGRERVRELIASADVLVEGFRPGVVERLGVGYEEAREIRPSLVYCSLSGYGAEGPYQGVPGHDLNYAGMAGDAIAQAPDALAAAIGTPVVDLSSATMVALSIVAALLGRERGGGVGHLDVAMLDSAVYWSAVKATERYWGGEADEEPPEAAYAVFAAADGRLLTIAAIEDKFWTGLCRALEWSDWLEDEGLREIGERRRRAVEIHRRLAETLARGRGRDEWLEVLWAADVPAAPVHSPSEVPDDPQVEARGLFERREGGGDAGRLNPPLPAALAGSDLAPAPERVGEHSEQILAAARRRRASA